MSVVTPHWWHLAGILCQTALLMLNEKGVDFKRHLVDYRDPPSWYLINILSSIQ